MSENKNEELNTETPSTVQSVENTIPVTENPTPVEPVTPNSEPVVAETTTTVEETIPTEQSTTPGVEIATPTGSETVVVSPVPKEEPKKKKKNTAIIVIAAILALIIIGFLAYKLYFGNSKRLTVKAIDKFSDKVENVMDKYLNTTDYGDKYTMTSKVSLKAESDYLQALANTSIDYLPYANLVKNLQNLDTQVVFAQNEKEKQALLQVKSNFKNEELINVKYLIQNNKQYYIIQNLLNAYVDNGESTYFETLSENASMTEDMKYVYEVALKSLKKNLKDSYFTNETEKITVNGKEESARKIIFTVDDKVAKEIATAILKDLKNDDKANKILVGLNAEFKNAKVDKDTTVFGEKSGIRLITYVNNITYQDLMYKMEMYTEDNVNSISYEEGKGTTPTIINLYENKSVIGVIEMTEKGNTVKFEFLDGSKTKLGTFDITSDKGKTTAKLALDIEGMAITLNLDSTQKEVTKGKEYATDATMNFKMEMQGMTLASVNLIVASEIKEGATIKEDITTATVSDATTDAALQQYMTNVLMKLMI